MSPSQPIFVSSTLKFGQYISSKGVTSSTSNKAEGRWIIKFFFLFFVFDIVLHFSCVSMATLCHAQNL